MVCLSSGTRVTNEIARDVLQAHSEGEKAAKAFMEERLISNNTQTFLKPIKRHAIKSFKDLAKTVKINIKGKEEILRADRSLFACMAVIAQTREMNMREVLSHPLGPLPWSLATIDGSLAKTPKSKLVSVWRKMWLHWMRNLMLLCGS